MNKFEDAISGYYTADQLSKVQSAKIGIAGAGGLGSNIAVCLARCGFKDFEIVDFDRIEAKNLNRQYYFLDEIGFAKVKAISDRLKRINPGIRAKNHKVRLTRKNITSYFQDRDIIFEAFDDAGSKMILLEAFGNSDKALIFGNGMAGIKNKALKIRKIKKNIYIVGDHETPVGKNNPPLAPRVTACAAMMASVALENILLNRG